jgi:hypothetical protein
MKAKNAKKLAQSVLAANIDNAAAQIVNELEKELDIAQIAYKAISLLIGEDTKGPNSIGVDNKTFEKYIQKARAKEDEKRRGSGRSRSSSGRSNKYDKGEKSGFRGNSRNRNDRQGKR